MTRGRPYPSASVARLPIAVLERLRRLPPALGRVAVAAAFVLTAVADAVTGPEVSWLLAYVVVVLMATWALHVSAGIVCAVASVVVTVAVRAPATTGASVVAWNGIGRTTVMLAWVWLLASLRQAVDDSVAAARSDPLTGAPNRLALTERIELEVLHTRRRPAPLSVAFFDVDGLKALNDRSGHDAGDEALRGVVDIAAAQLRATDLFARVGGDEFVLVMPHTDADEARAVVHRLLERLDRPGRSALSASAGVVTWPQAPPTVSDALSQADRAMYVAKTTRCGLHAVPADTASLASTPASDASRSGGGRLG